MNRERDERYQVEASGLQARCSFSARRRAFALLLLLLCLACLFTNIIANAHWPKLFTGPVMESQGGDYARFSHGSQRHASLACADCHHRADNSARPSWPGHKDCTGCHLEQFVTPNIPMCVICHTNVSGGDAALKNFPEKFKESFNVKFDHAQHMADKARLGEGCAFCHDRPLRRGVALSIPSGLLNAHGKCYTCHTPDSRAFDGREISSCGACHERARYAPTQTNARAFRAGFSHAAHSPRQRLDCASCHNLLAGLPQSRQVTSPATAQHFNSSRAMSCMTCHNGKRAFGGDLDFESCRRCHTGPTFRM